jgi:hypothetical protein
MKLKLLMCPGFWCKERVAHHGKSALRRMGPNFPDQAMTLAAVGRLVHHATISEMNVDSYRRKAAVEKTRVAGRPAARATNKISS